MGGFKDYGSRRRQGSIAPRADAARRRFTTGADASRRRPCQYHKRGDDARLRAARRLGQRARRERAAAGGLQQNGYNRRSNKVLRGAKKPRGKDAGAKAADRAALVAADAAIAASRTSAAAQKQRMDAMTSAVKVAARLAHAKAAEAKRKARLAIQAAQKRPAAPPPAPATPDRRRRRSERARTSCGRWLGRRRRRRRPAAHAGAGTSRAGRRGLGRRRRPARGPGLVARMLDAEALASRWRRSSGAARSARLWNGPWRESAKSAPWDQDAQGGVRCFLPLRFRDMRLISRARGVLASSSSDGGSPDGGGPHRKQRLPPRVSLIASSFERAARD